MRTKGFHKELPEKGRILIKDHAPGVSDLSTQLKREKMFIKGLKPRMNWERKVSKKDTPHPHKTSKGGVGGSGECRKRKKKSHVAGGVGPVKKRHTSIEKGENHKSKKGQREGGVLKLVFFFVGCVQEKNFTPRNTEQIESLQTGGRKWGRSGVGKNVLNA